jgi:hypothetical protein
MILRVAARKKITSIRLDEKELAMLEERRIACGLSTVSETLRALISDPSARLFALFETGTRFAQIVVDTGLPTETIRAKFLEFESGFAGPPVVPIPIALETARKERLEIKARILREQNETRERIQERAEDARTQRQKASIAAAAARDEEAARRMRLESLSAPLPSWSRA